MILAIKKQAFEQLCREKALTLLMVSHSLEDAAKIASRAIVIDSGMIVLMSERKTVSCWRATKPIARCIGTVILRGPLSVANQ